jgi:hypothetical protein
LYAPKPGDFHVVEVPELPFLMIDGHGDPKRLTRVRRGRRDVVRPVLRRSRNARGASSDESHTVGPLEGLWSAEDPRAFAARDKSAWDWIMMIRQPAGSPPTSSPQRLNTRRRERPGGA